LEIQGLNGLRGVRGDPGGTGRSRGGGTGREMLIA